jgi:XTP/dITP diphosphohydrolase
MADDSGLEVDALDGAPGVRSARYAGEPCDYQANNAKLLRELDGKNNRRARFVTVIALCRPGKEPLSVKGTCEGVIIDEPRGANGFGYDPLFVPDGFSETFAELPAAVKNKISHRANALNEASKHWNVFFQSLEK